MEVSNYRISEVVIDWTKFVSNFFQHINHNENSRILFSAPFGTGKSTFLKQFFELSREEFTTVTLNPVNYAVASNEDVFELIKFDILTELIVRYKDELSIFRSNDFSLAMRTFAFLQQGTGLNSFFKKIISASGEIGKSGIAVLEAFQDLQIDFDQFSNDINDKDNISIHDFLSRLRAKEGSIYEMDDISSIITRCVNELKKEGETTTVLVLEDLDRLDPEHIFRLFNIFSAHHNYTNDQNKFGFDKVVFVCDIDNIRKIYGHRFGLGVDFTGYMNKFYSTWPFLFDGASFLKTRIGELLNGKPWRMDEAFKSRFNVGEFRQAVKHILSLFIQEGACTLRTLDHAGQYHLLTDQELIVDRYRRYYTVSFDFYVLIDFLRTLFPSLDVLEEKLLMIANRFSPRHKPGENYLRSPEPLERYIASICLEFLLPRDEIFNDEGPTNFDLVRTTIVEGVNIDYQLYFPESSRKVRRVRVTNIVPKSEEQSETNLNVGKIVLATLKKCIEDGFISR